MSRGNGSNWGTVEPEAVRSTLFEVKNWKDDAAPRLDALEGRVERVETKHDRLEHKIDNGFAALKAIGWVVGLIWTVAVVLFGFWLSARFGG